MTTHIQPGDGDPRHGTTNGYTSLGCRCEYCRGTPPAMPEPTWPGAPVMAGCNQSMAPRLHIRRHNAGPASRWECESSCAFSRWHDLVNPRPLTTAEYAQHGIPEPSK